MGFPLHCLLSPPNLAKRLDKRLKLLTGGSRTALPRRQALRALIDWSYDLLAPDEQMLFNRLGIFAVSSSLDAVALVCGDEGIAADGVLGLASSRIDKSPIFGETNGAHERYGMVESTRAYALEKLAVLGERGRVARRYAAHVREQAFAADAAFAPGNAWLASVQFEIDNDRAMASLTAEGSLWTRRARRRGSFASIVLSQAARQIGIVMK